MPTVTLIAVVLGLRLFVVEAFKLQSASMQPTLLVDDHVFVLKTRGLPERGDVVLFDYPADPRQAFLKRAVGLPGDELRVLTDGTVAINGWLVPRCKVGPANLPNPDGTTTQGTIYLEHLGQRSYLVLLDDTLDATKTARVLHGPYLVGADELFVLGDNRDNSADSRTFRLAGHPPVRLDTVKGRANVIWLAFGTGGEIVGERLGARIHKPRLPPGSDPELAAALERCLATRPSQTTPPSRRSAS
jgi:signal peptidase I